jgi:tetratricopeptide (TPR) repeat protein
MSRVIEIANRKGGVGKAAAVNLAACLGGTGWWSRGWKLFVAWVIVPPLLLCLLELGLRLAGLGVSTQLFVTRELRGETVCMANRAFFQQFYTDPIDEPFPEFSMPAKKHPDAYRVFVFGSSAAKGWPATDFSFWRILETMLRANRHGVKTEIYCLALTGANSHVMRAAAKACAAYEPDLFLVYMGNNELCGSVTQNMGWDRLPPRLALPLLRLSIPLNDLRLVQGLHGTRTFDFDRLPQGSLSVPEPEHNYQFFQSNVNDICEFAKAAGAQVLLCTVGTRLRACAPIETHASDLDPDAARKRDDAYDAGNTLRRQGRFQEALAAYARAAGMDSGHAGVAYGIASCRYELGEYADARLWFVRARELDVASGLRGAMNRINDILRGIAADRARDGVHLADSANALANASPHGIEGPELFLDQMHLSFEGNYVLARSVLETLARTDPRLGAQDSPLSLEECRLRLAMTPADLRDQMTAAERIEEFLRTPPEERRRCAIEELDAQIGTRADDLRLDACRNALQADPQNELVRTKYVRLLMKKGDAARVLEQAKSLVADFPYSWEAHDLLARSFAMTGDKRGAIETMRLLLSWRPDDPELYTYLGQLLEAENQPEAALAAFRTWFKLMPNAEAQLEIARLLVMQGNLPGAIKAYRRSLELEPGNIDTFEKYISVLCDANRKTEAKREIGRWNAKHDGQESKVASLYAKIGQTQDALLLLESKVISSGEDETSCRELNEFLRTNASTIPAPPVWKNLAERTSSVRVWQAYEQSLDEKDAEERLAAFRQLLRIKPDETGFAAKLQELLGDKAKRLEAAGDLQGAASACREAIPLNPENNQPVLHLEKMLSKSSPAERRNVWETIWKDNPGNSLIAAICGSARAATGDLAGAKEGFAAAWRIAPREAYLCVLAADALAAVGAWNDAADAYKRALALDPKLDFLQVRLDEAQEKAGRIQEPLLRLKAAVMSSGGDDASCSSLEGLLKRNASVIAAAPVWRELAEKTSSARVWKTYAQSLDEKDAEERMRAFRQLLRIDPDNTDAACRLQGLLFEQAGRLETVGDLPGALSAYREAIPLNPQNNQPVLYLEKALSKSSPAERREVWEKVWKDNPDNPLVAAFCGTARTATGDVGGAHEAFAAARRLAPGDWYCCVLAADALAAAGAWKDAGDTYERALALNPGLEYLHIRLDDARKHETDGSAPPNR